MILPALSVKQPWAWAILNAGKDVENRVWTTRYRGPILIHAAKGCTVAEFDNAVDWIDATACVQVAVPPQADIDRGGIVGAADLFGIFPPDDTDNRWHIPGQFGWRLGGATPLEFRPLKGRLGLFDVELTASEVIALRQAGLLPGKVGAGG